MLVQSDRSFPVILKDKLLLIQLIDKLLSDILKDTKQLQKGSSPFHCREVPNISVGDYLKRMAKFSNCSNSIFVLSLIYIDRIQEVSPDLVVNSYCIHRLLISTVMLAAKYAQDFYYKNEFYAKVGGISKTEINSLELELLSRLNYNLYVTDIEFKVYLQKLEVYSEVNDKNVKKSI